MRESNRWAMAFTTTKLELLKKLSFVVVNAIVLAKLSAMHFFFIFLEQHTCL